MNKVLKSFQYGDQTVTLETGRIARQASGAVLASIGDTTVLATVVAKKESSGLDFLPLTVDVEERTYAAGKIPGGFFKREGKPSEKAVLTCRLIDRPIRPLFPKGYNNETQIIITTVSIDPEIDYDIISMLASSAALYLSGCPFQGPIGSACVGYINDEYVLNPTKSQLEASQLELVVAGTEDAVLMVESEAKELSEEVMLGAVMFGHEQQQVAIKAIKEFAEEAGRVAWEYQGKEIDSDLESRVEKAAQKGIADAYAITEKQARVEAISEVKESVIAELGGEDDELAAKIKPMLKELESKVVRGGLLDGKPRIDGRDTTTIRPIAIETGVLPRTHGSALFTRGETQAVVVTTLGTERDSQIIDALGGEYKDAFIFHYNFPPYSVGEAGRVGIPKRREIGHGRLAKRGVQGVLPDGDLPYTLRVVSEITESNGSSSMASVCGASLSLMDAGIKLKAPVAGVAMGLIKDGDRFTILTDILGDEDHLGDMDFKVAGSDNGITALQMDIKINGITREIMDQALEQAKAGRLHILGEMAKVLSEGRDELSDYAPRITTMKINPDKIRDVIGKGGAVIRQLCEETGTQIDIDDDGTIKIAATSGEQAADAQQRIEAITAEVEEGNVYTGKVVRIVDFGAFVNILPGQDGLVHISQIANERVNKVEDYLEMGQEVDVKVLEVDRQGKVRLSIKALLEDEQDD